MRKTFLTVSVLLSIAVLSALLWGRFSEEDAPSASAGAALVAVTVPELTGDALEGEALFARNCADCHGADAAGRNGFGPPLVHKIYEPGHHGDGAFFLAAAQGVRAHHWTFGDMPPVETVTEAEVAKIVAYVRALQRANGIN